MENLDDALRTFLTKLRELCLEYDRSYGSYPEHEYEGFTVLSFALEQAGTPTEQDEIDWEKDLDNA